MKLHRYWSQWKGGATTPTKLVTACGRVVDSKYVDKGYKNVTCKTCKKTTYFLYK